MQSQLHIALHGRLSASVQCWLVDKWVWTGKGVAAGLTRNERSMKKKKPIKDQQNTPGKARGVASADTFVVFNTQFHISSVDIVHYYFLLLCGWWTNKSTSKNSPQTSCTTCFWQCLHLTTDRQAVWSCSRTAHTLPPMNHNFAHYLCYQWKSAQSDIREMLYLGAGKLNIIQWPNWLL